MLNWYSLAKNSVSAWWSHGPATLGAALAFYSAFSIGPLLVISMGIAELAFGQAAVTGEVTNQLTGLLGESGARAVETLLAGASHKQQGLLATLLGTLALVFTAVGVVVQLKESLNTIWNVQERPGSTLWNFVRSYVISLAAVISLRIFTVGFSRHNDATCRRRKILGLRNPHNRASGAQFYNFVWFHHPVIRDDVQVVT
jgi:membrane protein